MSDERTVKVYLVQRLSWQYGDDFYYRREEEDAPMRTFLDPAVAEAHRRELEWQHVQENDINPFGYVDGSLAERTSLPMDEFQVRLERAGMRFSEVDRLWEQYRSLGEEGRRQVWEVIDRLRFFQLVEMTVPLEE